MKPLPGHKRTTGDGEDFWQGVGLALWAGLLMLLAFLLILIVLLISAVSSPQAREWASWCQPQGDLGWHFYCDPEALPEPEDNPDNNASTAAPVEPSEPAEPSAVEVIAQMRAQLEEARAQAILEPTQEHVMAYLHLQQAMVEHASGFAQTWKQVIWQTPELDYEAEHPQGHLAKQITRARKTEQQTMWLANLSQTHGLIYIGAGSCRVCHVYGPLLRQFAADHNINVLAVSADGRALPGWPQAAADTGQLARLGLAGKPVPITALFERTTQSLTVIGTGLISSDELRRRIYALTAQGEENAF